MSVRHLRTATALIAVVQLLLTLVALGGSDEVRSVVAVFFVVIFLAGSLAFVWGFLVAVGRSRTDEVSVAGVFFLADGAVDSSDRRWFFAWLAAQVVIGLGGALLQPFTALAFGVLVPMAGMGIIALVGARHGSFPVRSSTN